MSPLTFVCQQQMSLAPEEIAAKILDVGNWTDFGGYGPLPGIETAEFEVRTAEAVGSRICVTNSDGSHHVEDIVEWDPPHRLRMRLHEFSPPLSRLAREFDEIWDFEREKELTIVTRTFRMHPTSVLTRPLLWWISLLLRRAVARHLKQMHAIDEVA